MAYNVFSSKKKPLIYASGQGDQYANNTANKSVYQPQPTQKAPLIQTSGKSFLGIPEKVTIGGSKVVQKPQTQPVTSIKSPTMTVSGKIPASGSGSQYANQTLPRTTVTAPTTQEKPVQSSAEKYMANIQALGLKQQNLAKQRASESEARLKDQYRIANEGLGGELITADADLNNLRDSERLGLEEARRAADTQKQTTSDYYGEAQRLAAQTRNETRGQTGRTFANLGTIDSRGEGSYQQGMENIDSEFNRETQKRLTEKANKLSDIDALYKKAELESSSLIRTKEAEKTKLAQQIRLAQQQNNLDMASKLAELWQSADDTISAVEENLMNLRYASELETEKTQQEIETMKNLSEGFLTSGKPSTMNDFMFVKNNPDYAKNIAAMGLGKTNNATVVDAIDRVLGGNTAGISGAATTSWIPGVKIWSGSGQTQSDWEALKSMLSLEGREKLKGSGAISDFEAKILAQAATEGIDPTNMSTEQFVSRLQDLKNRLSDGSSQRSSTIRVRENSSGQVGTIPSNEFDPNLYTRI